MTTEEFKKTFKVGGQIKGYGTGLIFTITAIGENRFLYRRGDGQESVGTMNALTPRWRKVFDL